MVLSISARHTVSCSPLLKNARCCRAHFTKVLQIVCVRGICDLAVLIYLNQDTFVEAEGQALAAVVQNVMKTGIDIVLAHEIDECRRGCHFDRHAPPRAQPGHVSEHESNPPICWANQAAC
eukprot:4077336-Prymnesium_polylepis.1